MGNWWHEIRELTRIRVLLFLREPEAIFWVFVFPVVLAAVLGFAFRSGGIEPSQLAVVGQNVEAFVEACKQDEDLDIEIFDDLEAARSKLANAAVDAVLSLDDPVSLWHDPDRAESATAKLRVQRVLGLLQGGSDPVVELVSVNETGSRYVDFLFPGLLGMNLMGTGMWGIGFAIADVRRRKFLKRLMVTPMRRSSFFLSFMLSRLVFLFMEMVVLAGFGRWVLGVPFEGDLLSFSLVCLLGAMTFAGLGILVASRAKTIEGVSGLMNFTMMPMWLASGVFFSYEKFPEAIHPLLRLLPLTALNDALRGVMLEGQSILMQGPEVICLLGWTVVTFLIALKIFRWE